MNSLFVYSNSTIYLFILQSRQWQAVYTEYTVYTYIAMEIMDIIMLMMVPIWNKSPKIKSMIIGGQLERESVPSPRVLAKDLRISVVTKTFIYDLERDGFIITIGKGYFVGTKHQFRNSWKKVKHSCCRCWRKQKCALEYDDLWNVVLWRVRIMANCAKCKLCKDTEIFFLKMFRLPSRKELSWVWSGKTVPGKVRSYAWCSNRVIRMTGKFSCLANTSGPRFLWPSRMTSG